MIIDYCDYFTKSIAKIKFLNNIRQFVFILTYENNF